MVTHTSEYTVKDTCLAIQLFNEDFIFADKVTMRGNDVGFIRRGSANKSWDWINKHAVVEITVGICPLGACQG